MKKILACLTAGIMFVVSCTSVSDAEFDEIVEENPAYGANRAGLFGKYCCCPFGAGRLGSGNPRRRGYAEYVRQFAANHQKADRHVYGDGAGLKI